MLIGFFFVIFLLYYNYILFGMSRLCVGIDLGTSNSCAYYKNYNNPPAHVPIDQGSNLLPSVVCFMPTETVVGRAAVVRLNAYNNNSHHRTMDSSLYVYNTKRVLGLTFDEVQSMDQSLCYANMKRGEDGMVEFVNDENTRTSTPVLAATEILKDLVRRAEAIGGSFIESLVVTIPARFTKKQKECTELAVKCAISSSTKFKLIPEPVAAAVAYGILNNQKKQTFVVYDLGGGTFDVTILRVENGIFEVLETDGDANIGGVVFDKKLVEYVETDVSNSGKSLVGPNASQRAKRRIHKKVEDRCCELKMNLSTLDSGVIDLSDIIPEYDIIVHRAVFERIIGPEVDTTISIMERAITNAKLTKDDIATVILIGGSSLIPLVKKKIVEYFGKPDIIAETTNQLEAVAQGGCMIADSLAASHYSNILRIGDNDLYLERGIVITVKGSKDKVIDKVIVSETPCARYYKSMGDHFAAHFYYNDKKIGGLLEKKSADDILEVEYSTVANQLHVKVSNYMTQSKITEQTFPLKTKTRFHVCYK